jgi:NADH:ubiquinone reductase (H+-translocating)
MRVNVPELGKKRVVIIGGGFAGVELAVKLRHSNFQVVMIDRNNYHTFQPLLYQVATGGLEPGSIAYPLRKALRRAQNAIFRLANVEAVIPEENKIRTDSGLLKYDYLVIASGSTTNFFSFPAEVSGQMMSLKSIPEALDFRSFILQNFEQAHYTDSDIEKEQLFHIAIVGGGPTGVEMAGALGEMKKSVLPKDYPELDFRKMQIHLFEAGPRLLAGMSEESSARALEYVRDFDVNVWLNTIVTGYSNDVLTLNDGNTLRTSTVMWSAGVKGNAIEGLPYDAYAPGGRIKVDEHNRVAGTQNIFAIGDVAAMLGDEFPKGHPMVAPVAIQQAYQLAKNLLLEQQGKPMQPFRYVDKGSMATVGRNKAVVDIGKVRFGGLIAWFAWMFVHLITLVGFRNKLVVFVNWVYNYFTYDRTLRLIIRPFRRSP